MWLAASSSAASRASTRPTTFRNNSQPARATRLSQLSNYQQPCLHRAHTMQQTPNTMGILPELRNTLSQFVLPTPNHVPVHATDDVCPCRLGVVSRHFLEHSTRKKSNASHDTRRHNPLEMLLILERCKFSRFFLMSLQLRFSLDFRKSWDRATCGARALTGHAADVEKSLYSF